MGLTYIIFEPDAKFTVDVFHSNRLDLSEFGSIIQDCQIFSAKDHNSQFVLLGLPGITVLNLLNLDSARD